MVFGARPTVALLSITSMIKALGEDYDINFTFVLGRMRDTLTLLLSGSCRMVIFKTECENDAAQSAPRRENPPCACESIYSRRPSGLWLISDNQRQLLDLQYERSSYSDFCFTDNTA